MTALLEEYSVFFILPALTFFLSLVLTRIFIYILRSFNVFAPRGERHIHKKDIPTMGGVAIAGAFSIAMFFAYISPWKFYLGPGLIEVEFVKLFIPLIILLPCCMIDDRFGMRVRYKLLLQILTAALAWYCGARINSLFGYEIPQCISLTLTIFWIVSFINAFNFIDGLDGLAAGISVVSAVCLSIVLFLDGALLYSLVLLCLAGSCLGFLRYNFYPARIFMGDTGSMFLGYMFSTIALLSSSKGFSFSAIAIPVLACGIPLIDTFLAIWRRITFKLLDKNDKERGITVADNEHLHHRFLEHSKSQRATSILFYRIALFLGGASVLIATIKNSIPGIAMILLLTIFCVIIQKFAVIEIWNSTKLIFRGFKKPSKSVLLNMLHPLWDLFIVALAAFIASYILGCSIISFSELILIYTAPVILLLVLSKNYKIFWFRTSISDYFYLGKVLTFAYFLTFVLTCFYIKYNSALKVNIIYVFSLCLFAYLFAGAGILGERFWLRWLQTALITNFYESHLNKKSIPTMLCGGGLNSYLFMRRQNSSIREDSFHVEGIIDDNPAFKGLYLYGYKVWGGVNDLDKIYSRKPFKKVIVTTASLKEDSKKVLKEFCVSHDIEILCFSTQVKNSPCDKIN